MAGVKSRRLIVLSTPWWFAGFLVVAGFATAYVWLLQRRRRDTMAFTNLDLLERVAPKRPGWRRHIPAVALMTATALLLVALAGPQADARVR